MRILALCIISLACAACGVYKSEWDCPPGEGVRCKSVSDVMDLIVEKEEGQDMFFKEKSQADALRAKPKAKTAAEEEKTLYLMKKTSGGAVMVEAKP